MLITLTSLGNNFNNLFVIIRRGSTDNATYETVTQARDDGAVTFNYGNFLQTVVNFFFIAFALFWIVKGIVLSLLKIDWSSHPFVH